jgi:C-methyltransferase C-terminal domain/Putative zinc binding domain
MSGDLVLDLGEQPPADFFPPADDPGPDAVYPLQMWLCATCSLAQLVADPTLPEEPRAIEPAALMAQARDAVESVAVAGYFPAGATVAEYASPHGGSWLEPLGARGLVPMTGDEAADLVVDCFGMMHARDQAGAVARRGARLGERGVLFLQYHSLETIVRRGQWNALRHGHYAYYSTTALASMLARAGFAPLHAWEFDLYGGTVLLAAVRTGDGRRADDSVDVLLAREQNAGVCDPAIVGRLQDAMQSHAEHVRDWLVAANASGRRVVGYGAASRAVALLVHAGVEASLLPAVVDASPAKYGRRMPGTDIPVVDPSHLRHELDDVLVFVPELVPEVRSAFPEVEAAGGRWVDAEALA